MSTRRRSSLLLGGAISLLLGLSLTSGLLLLDILGHELLVLGGSLLGGLEAIDLKLVERGPLKYFASGCQPDF